MRNATYRNRLFVKTNALLVGTVGSSVLLGWVFDISVFKSVLPGYISMKANTAVGLIVCAAAIWLLDDKRPSKPRLLATHLCSTFVATLGILTLIEYLFGFDFHIDQLLFLDPQAVAGHFPPGRLAPMTAVTFTLLGISGVLLNRKKESYQYTAQFLILTSFLICFQALVAYFCGVTYSFGSAYYTQMAIHTALGFVLLCSSLLYLGRDFALMRVFTADNAGGKMARRLIVSAVLFPPFFNWAQILGQKHGLYDADFGVLLRIMGNVVFFTILVWRNAFSLQKTSLEVELAEKARHTSETHFQTLCETIPQIIWTADKAGNFLFFNHRWTEYTGMSPEETARVGWDCLIHPDDLELFKQRWTRAVETGEAYELKYRLNRSADDTYRWHLRRAIPLRDSLGKVMWFGTCTDIHDQKIAYDSVVESKNLVDMIVSNTDAVLFSINAEGVVTYSEGHGLQALGVKGGERVGKSVFELHKHDPFLLDIDRRALRGEKFSVRTQTGDQWLEIHYNPVFDAHGTPNGTTGVAFNITQKVLSERTLSETQDKLKAVLKHVPFAFWAIDKNRKYIFREGTGLKALEMSSEEMIGRSVDEVFQHAPEVLGALNRAFSGESLEIQTELADRCYTVALAPLINEEGKTVGVSGITFDITDKKRLEEERTSSEIREKSALEASRLKSDFLANMSHEIRTPINGVIGMLGLLSNTELNPQQREYAATAKFSADALLTVINDILDFSKVEAGKLEFEDLDFDLHHLFKNVEKAFSFQAHSKEVKLVLEIKPETPKYVGGDPGRLRQILNNLLSNALKFTSKGEVSITIHAEEVGITETEFRVEIKDSGIGIPKADISKMFHAFSQADASTTRRFGGTGLGLSICKHLVEKLNGTIGVESTEGQGSMFWFTLSLRNANAPKHSGLGEVGNFRELTDRQLRVLVAEDNPVNQVIAVTVLENMGLSADAVANGKEVLDALQSIPYDLILMDCQMPEMDGYEATRQIRASETLPKPDITVIAMTANAIQGDKERCLAAGMNDYVSKPVKNDELFAVLSRWLLSDKQERRAA